MHILVCLGLAGLSIYTALEYRQQQEQWAQEQLRTPGSLLTAQYAQLLLQPMQAEDTLAITKTLNVLASDPRVLQAGVFDSRGVQIAPVDPLRSLLLQTGVAVTHVKDIRNEAGSVLGYVRVLMRQSSEQFAPVPSLQFVQWLTMLTVALVGLVSGVYLTRFFYKARPALKEHYFALGQSRPESLDKNRRR